MKRIVTLTPVLLLCCLSWSQKESIFKGTVTNPTSETVSIKGLDGYDIERSPIVEGKFEIEFTTAEGFYSLSHGNTSTDIYVIPGQTYIADFDGLEMSETIVYSGDGINRHNYLNSLDLKYYAKDRDLEAIFRIPELEYNLKKLQEADEKLVMLKSANTETPFYKAQLKNIEYGYLFNLYNYSKMRKFYFDEDISPSAEFLAPLKEINYDLDDDFKRFPYYNYLASSYWKDKIHKQDGVNEMRHTLFSIKSDAIKQDVFVSFYYSISTKKDKAREYLELIKGLSNSKRFIERAEEKFAAIEATLPGAVVPNFSFEDIDNNKHSLFDLKGKYILIDVWATWCAPCIQQIPALKELEATYHDADIAFISISVDRQKAYDKWAKMVKEKQLGGLQLWADKSFDSEWVEAMGITSIPRFILIDKEGKIIDADLKKPSTETTKSLLADLLAK